MRNDRYAPTTMGTSWGAGMAQRVFDTRVLPLFGGGLMMAALTAYFGMGLPLGLCIAAMVAEFILVLTSGMWSRNENAGLNVGLYFLVTALAGLASVPLMRWAMGMGGPGLIVQAFAVSGLTFGGLMAYSLVTKRNF
ncbi:MAG TPA: Bax inhibitor-1 family protein, partial [Candidatus Obscuribacterales bacterium]